MTTHELVPGVAAMILVAAGLMTPACADEGGGDTANDDGSGAGTSDGGSTTQGGNGPGGSAQGGNGQGGNAQGGMMSGDACDAPEIAPSMGSCALDMDGLLPFQCNPVTNDGCADTESCDVSGFSDFECYDGNTAGICEPCDQSAANGPFCQTGMTCYAPDPNEPQNAGTLTECARYCCNNADCAGATCVKATADGPWFQQAPNIGVCQNM